MYDDLCIMLYIYIYNYILYIIYNMTLYPCTIASGSLDIPTGRVVYGAGVPAGPAGLPSGKAPAVAMQVG